jgi:GNAT superfamily N-acetyltransferase
MATICEGTRTHILVCEALATAVGNHNVEEVRTLLQKGADPNYDRGHHNQEQIYVPTTPLEILVFRISDCMLTDKDLHEFEEIAKLLVEAGAETADALVVAKTRYDYTGDPEYEHNMSPFFRILHIILRGKQETLNEVRIRRGSHLDLESIVRLTFSLAKETEKGLVLDVERTRFGVAAGLRTQGQPVSGSMDLRPRYWIASIADPDTERGELDVGFLASSPEWSDWWGVEYWWITSVFVDSRWRRRGVARRLFEAAFKTADDANVQTINLRVERSNEAAKQFYRSVGFAVDDSHIVMSRGKRPDGSRI